MPDVSVALSLLKKPIEAVYDLAAGQAKEYVAHLRTAAAVKELYGKLSATQKVKTIWNVDRPIALSSFYYPARIETKHGSQQLSSLDELPSNHVVLLGIVGQGKSILLRYLLGKEIRSGKRVPVLVELRRVPPQKDLESYVLSSFGDLMGGVGNNILFSLFAANGRLCLLLDGFDEVDHSRVHEFATSIDILANKYPSLRIIVTSRPNSGIENSPLFDVIPIAPLSQEDLPGFFAKVLNKDKDLAQRITDATAMSSAVAKMASTPLLATLLTIVYRAHQKIPTDFPEFYDEVFQILLVRHDRSKNGYERKRRTELSDRDLQLVFEAFCFKTRAEGKPELSEIRALELARQSASAQQLACAPDSFLHDIKKITCLLQEEAGRIEFLHQSVQEFFAARYIASRPEDVARLFYELAVSEEHWQQWDQVVKFLSELDKYRASKYFFIPVLSEALNRLGSLTGAISTQHLRKLVASKIGVRQSLIPTSPAEPIRAKYFIHQIAQQPIYRIERVHKLIYQRFFNADSPIASRWQSLFDKETPGQFISYEEIARRLMKLELLDEALTSGILEIRAELEAHTECVRHLNQSTAFMGL